MPVKDVFCIELGADGMGLPLGHDFQDIDLEQKSKAVSVCSSLEHVAERSTPQNWSYIKFY